MLYETSMPNGARDRWQATKRSPPKWSKARSNAAPAGQLNEHRGQALRIALDNVMHAVGQREISLLWCGGGPDHAQAAVARHLHQRRSHTAGRAANQDRPGRQVAVARQHGQRQPEVAEAHGILEADRIGEHEGRGLGHADGFGIAAAALRELSRAHKHAQANLQRGDARADGILAAWFERHHCKAALVRPDHLVYGVARSLGDTETLMQRACRTLGITLSCTQLALQESA